MYHPVIFYPTTFLFFTYHFSWCEMNYLHVYCFSPLARMRSAWGQRLWLVLGNSSHLWSLDKWGVKKRWRQRQPGWKSSGSLWPEVSLFPVSGFPSTGCMWTEGCLLVRKHKRKKTLQLGGASSVHSDNSSLSSKTINIYKQAGFLFIMFAQILICSLSFYF